MTPDQLAWATVTPRKCRHEYDYAESLCAESGIHPVACSAHTQCPTVDYCRFCGKPRDPVASRRGRNNRSRGNAIERDVAKQLGMRRVGMYGGPEDVGTASDPFIVQVKSGKSFPERLYRWLRALPSNANQTPLLVITDAPGPGRKRRALVVLTMEDWVALHGEVGERE